MALETNSISDILASHYQIDKLLNQMMISLGIYKERGRRIPEEWLVVDDRRLRLAFEKTGLPEKIKHVFPLIKNQLIRFVGKLNPREVLGASQVLDVRML